MAVGQILKDFILKFSDDPIPSKVSHTSALRTVIAYVRRNGLTDVAKPQVITLDDTLKTLFQTNIETTKFIKLMPYIGVYFPPKYVALK